MKTNWYLLASRTGVKIFEQLGVKPQLKLVQEITHPEGNLQNREIVSDRQGSPAPYKSFSQHHTPHETDLDDFIREIGAALKESSLKKRFDYLTLVAEPKMLGRLRELLPEAVLNRVRTTLTKDLAYTPEHELLPHLQEVLMTVEPIENR